MCKAFNCENHPRPQNLVWRCAKNLYGFPTAGDNFDEHLGHHLETYGFITMCEDVTVHTWILVPKEKRDGSWRYTDISILLVKYVDDCRWRARREADADDLTEFLETIYGKFSDLVKGVGPMLSKEYFVEPHLDKTS